MDLPDRADTVHRYQARLSWQGSTAAGYDHYDRSHQATTEPATVALALNGDPAFGGDARQLNPEQLVVLAAASCQLLSFLAVAARARVDVLTYADAARGEMPEGDRPVRLTRITLEPHITVNAAPRAGEDRPVPTEARVRHLVAVAHRECFVANSLRTEIVVLPTIAFTESDRCPASDL